jgi:hypothetical protein
LFPSSRNVLPGIAMNCNRSPLLTECVSIPVAHVNLWGYPAFFVHGTNSSDIGNCHQDRCRAVRSADSAPNDWLVPAERRSSSARPSGVNLRQHEVPRPERQHTQRSVRPSVRQATDGPASAGHTPTAGSPQNSMQLSQILSQLNPIRNPTHCSLPLKLSVPLKLY